MAIGAAFLAVMPVAAATGIASGDYGELLVGVDPATRTISGYYRSSTGAGRFNCIFYLAGTAAGGEIPIRSWFPGTPDDVIKGAVIGKAAQSILIRLSEEHGGCWNVQHFADRDQTAAFELQTAYPWVSVAVVKNDRAPLFGGPNPATRRRSYLVKGDGVGVRAVRSGWLRVDYVGGAKPVSGWLRASDIYPRLPRG